MKHALHQTDRAGYTLLEMVAASLGAGILLVGLSSSLFIALRATETSQTPTTFLIKANEAILELEADLEFALAFTERSSRAMTFLVPDRDGDGDVETIRYAWSGTRGDPLTRQYNGGAIANFAENVHVFQYDLPGVAANLLSNPGMEAGTLGWEAMAGATIESATSPVHQGSLSLHAFQNSTNSESGFRQDITSQISNGTTYRVGAWVRKTTPGVPNDARFQIRINSTVGGQKVFATSRFPISGTQFRRVKGFITPTWGGMLLSAYWECTTLNKIPEIYVDEVELRTGSSRNQQVHLSLQVGPDAEGLLQSAVRLLNSPL